MTPARAAVGMMPSTPTATTATTPSLTATHPPPQLRSCHIVVAYATNRKKTHFFQSLAHAATSWRTELHLPRQPHTLVEVTMSLVPLFEHAGDPLFDRPSAHCTDHHTAPHLSALSLCCTGSCQQTSATSPSCPPTDSRAATTRADDAACCPCTLSPKLTHILQEALQQPRRDVRLAILHKTTNAMAAVIAHADAPSRTTLDVLTSALEHGVRIDDAPTTATATGFHEADGHAAAGDSRVVPVTQVDSLRGVWRLVDRVSLFRAIDRVLRVSPTSTSTTPSPCTPDEGEGDLESDSDHPVIQPASASRDTTDVAAGSLPWGIVTLDEDTHATRERLKHLNLRFPIILKRRLGCGLPESHTMIVAADIDAAVIAITTIMLRDQDAKNNNVSMKSGDVEGEGVTGDIIAQEFVKRHGGVLFKVYVIGSHVTVQARGSVAPPPKGTFFSFDSQSLNRRPPPGVIVETPIIDDDSDDVNGNVTAETAKRRIGIGKDSVVRPTDRLVHTIVDRLRRELGLTLFGVDLVYDIDERRYYAVDVNYFPGFKNMEGAMEILLQHIAERVWCST